MGATTPCLPAMDAQVPTTPGDAVDPTDAGADAALSGDAAEAELGDAGDVQLSDAAAAMADSAASVDTSTPPASACAIEREDPRSEGAGHTNKLCEPVSYKSHPPSSGTHYGTWPVFRAYSEPVPWGFLVHGLEHGAVVIAYNCPQGCAAEVAAAKALMASVPNKEGCSRPPVILTPDPTLRTRFAAAAWGHVLRASCFDRPAFAAFISAYANKGPEYFPSDCGAVDYEGMGWCPTCK